MEKHTAGRLKVMELLPTIGAGGAERLVLDIVKYLDSSRFDPVLVSLYSQEHCHTIYQNFSKETGIRVLYLDKKPGLDISLVGKLSRLIREERPDILHTHLYAVIYSLFPASRCPVPVRVHTVHNVADKELPPLYQKIMKSSYKRKKVTPVAISPLIQESLCLRYALEKSAVPCIDNGVDIRRFAPLGISEPHQTIRFINVARFSSQKNHRLLLRAFQHVRQEFPDVILRLVGDGELRGEIEEQIQKLGLSDSVELLGVRSDVEKQLQDSDVFVLSSDYEGLPLSVMEAMAAGRPVVSTRAGGVPNAVTDGLNGILVDVGDVDALAEGMLRLAKDTSLRHRMAEAALTASKQFDIRVMVSRYEELFQELYAQNVR